MTFYIATTKPQCEFKAVDELRAKGVEAFTPREFRMVKTFRPTVRRSRHAKGNKASGDEMVEKVAPFLRRYMAVQADTETVLWKELDGSRYGAKPLQITGRVARLVPREVDALKALDGKKHDDVKPTPIALQAGDEVRIMEGPFIGFPSVVGTIDGQKLEATVTVQLFGRTNELKMPVTSLQKA